MQLQNAGQSNSSKTTARFSSFQSFPCLSFEVAKYFSLGGLLTSISKYCPTQIDQAKSGAALKAAPLLSTIDLLSLCFLASGFSSALSVYAQNTSDASCNESNPHLHRLRRIQRKMHHGQRNASQNEIIQKPGQKAAQQAFFSHDSGRNIPA